MVCWWRRPCRKLRKRDTVLTMSRGCDPAPSMLDRDDSRAGARSRCSGLAVCARDDGMKTGDAGASVSGDPRDVVPRGRCGDAAERTGDRASLLVREEGPWTRPRPWAAA